MQASAQLADLPDLLLQRVLQRLSLLDLKNLMEVRQSAGLQATQSSPAAVCADLPAQPGGSADSRPPSGYSCEGEIWASAVPAARSAFSTSCPHRRSCLLTTR